jgi:hypothetical protein
MTVLSASELKKSKELRSKIDKEIGYSEKRKKVLDNLTPLGKLKTKVKSIKVDKDLRQRRRIIFEKMYSNDLTKDQVKNSKYLGRMFSGEKIKDTTFDQACEKAKEWKEKSDQIQAKIVESKNFSAWSQIGQGFKKALGFSEDKNKCPICKGQIGNSNKKRKKHMSKCNKKLEAKAEKIKKDFVKYQKSKKKKKVIHTSFNDNVRSRYYHDQYMGEKYNGNGLGSNRRGALSGGVF